MIPGCIGILWLASGLAQEAEETLAAIAAHTPVQHELLALVRGTPELAAACAAAKAPLLRVPAEETAWRAVRRAMRFLPGEYLLVLAGGFRPEPGWLESLLAQLDIEPNSAAVLSRSPAGGSAEDRELPWQWVLFRRVALAKAGLLAAQTGLSPEEAENRLREAGYSIISTPRKETDQ